MAKSLNLYESQIFNHYYRTKTEINDKIITLDNLPTVGFGFQYINTKCLDKTTEYQDLNPELLGVPLNKTLFSLCSLWSQILGCSIIKRDYPTRKSQPNEIRAGKNFGSGNWILIQTFTEHLLCARCFHYLIEYSQP